MATPKEERKQPNWRFSRGRKDSLEKARLIKNILINIGKKYRNKEAHMFKAVPKILRKNKPVKR